MFYLANGNSAETKDDENDESAGPADEEGEGGCVLICIVDLG